MSNEGSAAAALFPVAAKYELKSGETVEVRPWSIETLEQMLQRVPRLIEGVLEGDPTSRIVELFPVALGEITFLVARSVNWSPEELRAKCDAEDLLGLAEVVWSVCVEGPAAKALGLASAVAKMFRQPNADDGSQKPSST